MSSVGKSWSFPLTTCELEASPELATFKDAQVPASEIVERVCVPV